MGAKPGDQALAVIINDEQALLTRLTQRGGKSLVGTLNFSYGRVTLVPDKRREGSMPILRDLNNVIDRYRAGDRVVATVVEDEFMGFGAELERVLDQSDPEVADFEQVRLVHDLPGDFPEDLLQKAEAITSDFDPAGRRDCRNDLVFTIDPDTAKDFDDAICLEEIAEGGGNSRSILRTSRILSAMAATLMKKPNSAGPAATSLTALSRCCRSISIKWALFVGAA